MSLALPGPGTRDRFHGVTHNKLPTFSPVVSVSSLHKSWLPIVPDQAKTHIGRTGRSVLRLGRLSYFCSATFASRIRGSTQGMEFSDDSAEMANGWAFAGRQGPATTRKMEAGVSPPSDRSAPFTSLARGSPRRRYHQGRQVAGCVAQSHWG